MVAVVTASVRDAAGRLTSAVRPFGLGPYVGTVYVYRIWCGSASCLWCYTHHSHSFPALPVVWCGLVVWWLGSIV